MWPSHTKYIIVRNVRRTNVIMPKICVRRNVDGSRTKFLPSLPVKSFYVRYSDKL